MTHLGQELQDIPFLLTQGKNRRQNAFNKEAALFALGAKTTFSPQNPASQRPFGGVIGGFNAFVIHKGPHSRFEFENIGAGFAGGSMIGQHTNLQQSFDLSPNGLDQCRKICTAQGTLSDPMPMAKYKFGLLEQQFTMTRDSPPRSIKA